jgi:hypothetical protein
MHVSRAFDRDGSWRFILRRFIRSGPKSLTDLVRGPQAGADPAPGAFPGSPGQLRLECNRFRRRILDRATAPRRPGAIPIRYLPSSTFRKFGEGFGEDGAPLARRDDEVLGAELRRFGHVQGLDHSRSAWLDLRGSWSCCWRECRLFERAKRASRAPAAAATAPALIRARSRPHVQPMPACLRAGLPRRRSFTVTFWNPWKGNTQPPGTAVRKPDQPRRNP